MNRGERRDPCCTIAELKRVDEGSALAKTYTTHLRLTNTA